MKTKFTPGPWHLDDTVAPENACVFDSNNELIIAGEYEGYMSPFSAKGSSEAEANAYLVSTSPELYSILQEALDEELAFEDSKRVYGKWVEKAKQVLAKARGEVA